MDNRVSILTSVAAVLLGGYTATTGAAFFQLAENSPAGLGNAFAGGAAIAEDASTVWYNPAGLTRLPGSQLVGGGHYIAPSTKFSKTSASTALGSTIGGGDGGDTAVSAFIPNVYFSHQINDRLTFGLGVNAPYGLATDYEDDWVGRYYANRSEIKTVNVNPSVGYKLNDRWSIGGGVSYQKIEAEIGNSTDLGTACVASLGVATCSAISLAPQQDDAKIKNAGDDVSYGYNLGLLWQPDAQTRVGLAYRSAIKHKLLGKISVVTTEAGQASFAANLGAVDGNAIRADIELPSTLSLSAYSQVGTRWALMGDVTRTNWSSLPELRIRFDSGASDSVITLHLKNVYRYSLGVAYSTPWGWVYRAGVALDQGATPNEADRSPRVPDADRQWLAFGAGYRKSKDLDFDIAYTYITVDDGPMNKTATGENTLRGNLQGSYSAHTSIISAQVRWMLQ
jgi:long-chain fatty acid transport protein